MDSYGGEDRDGVDFTFMCGGNVPTEKGTLSGMSECALIKREDCVLFVLEVRNYCISYSIDNGLTWRTDAEISAVYATNTMPVIETFKLAGQDDVTVMVWPCTSMMGAPPISVHP